VINKRFVCVILIPENFIYNLASPFGENISIILFLDNSEPQMGAVLLKAFQDAFRSAACEFRENLGIIIDYSHGKDISTLNHFGSAMIAFRVFLLHLY